VTEFDSRAFNSFVKYLDEQGKSITVPKPGDTFRLGRAEVTVLAPIKPSDEPNNTSIVLRLVYGKTSFLFTGDAERAEEADILEAGYEPCGICKP
jgi:competence protein ComEC